MGIKTRRKLDRVYRRIDEVLRNKAGAGADRRLRGAAATRPRGRSADSTRGWTSWPATPSTRSSSSSWGPTSPPPRPRRSAASARSPWRAGSASTPDEVCNACLHATRAGLLILSWDLLCPLCRIPSQFEDTLKAVRDHAHCPACAADFEVDFSRSVEMIFRVHPSIREAETGTYCIGGPAHSPHVVAQVRVAPGERLELPLELAEGAYRLRGPQLPSAVDARVERGLYPSLLGGRSGPARVGRGRRPARRAQMLALANTHDRELVVRLERTAPRDDALTAARAASMALFRELFPGEVLGPGQLVSVSTITLVATELAGIRGLAERAGENRAFEVLHEHLRQVDALARRHGGALLKAVGDGAIAAFHEPGRRGAARPWNSTARPRPTCASPCTAAPPWRRRSTNGSTTSAAASAASPSCSRAARPGERLFDHALRDDVAIGAIAGHRAGAAPVGRGGGGVCAGGVSADPSLDRRKSEAELSTATRWRPGALLPGRG